METICCGSTAAVEFSLGNLIAHHSSFSYHFLSFLKVKISRDSSLKTFSDKQKITALEFKHKVIFKWTILLIKYVATERNHILYCLWMKMVIMGITTH